MTDEKYFEITNQISEEFIMSAAPVHKEKKYVPLKFILTAAVIALVIVSLLLGAYSMGTGESTIVLNSDGTSSYESNNSVAEETATTADSVTAETTDNTENTAAVTDSPVTEPDYVNGLPVLTPELAANGFGFEGMLVYDISELDKNDPFDPEKHIDTLPVYENLAYDIKSAGLGIIRYYSREELKSMVDNAARELGAVILSYRCDGFAPQYHDDGCIGYPEFSSTEETYENEIIIRYVGVTNGFTITAFYNGSVRYSFNEDTMLPLPEHLLPSTDKTTQEEKRLIVDYIVSTYSEYFTCDKLTGGDTIDYTFSGEYYDIYNKWLDDYYENLPDDYVQSILNYSFNKYHFRLNEELTHVVSITIPGDYTAYTEKLGDYPVISCEEALERLCAGKYLSTVSKEYLPDGIITEDIVHSTEILYLNPIENEIVMPYYKFYVLLELKHEKSPEGLKNYGVFYVPAVSSEYLKTDSVVINGQWGMSNENT